MIPKKKLTLSIDAELNRRLDLQATFSGKGHDRSSIVDALVVEHIQLPDDWKHHLAPASASPDRTDDKPSPRQREKTTFYLSAQAALILGLHAQLTEADRSSIVEGLIRDHVTPWDLYDPREKYLTSRSKGRQSGADSISPPIALSA